MSDPIERSDPGITDPETDRAAKSSLLMTDARALQTYAGFCDLSLPKAQWTHEAHLASCWATLRTNTVDSAVDFLRDAISAYNTATGVENTTDSGYHETVSRYFVGAVAAVQAEHIDQVLASDSCQRQSPFAHWSRESLMTSEARARWLVPDLSPLPWA